MEPMQYARLLAATLISAATAAGFVLVLWFFFSLQKQWGLAAWLPPASLAWLLPTAAAIGGSLGLAITAVDQIHYARRTRANQEFASRFKLDFEEKPARIDWPEPLIRVLHRGDRNEWLQRCGGTFAGLPLDVVDLRYTVQSSDSEGGSRSVTYEHTVACWNVGDTSLPSFSIVPRTWDVALARLLGGNPAVIGFDAEALGGPHAQTVREFNQHYVVMAKLDAAGDAEQQVRRICVPEIMRTLSEQRVCVAAHGGFVAFWQPRQVFAGDQRQQRLQETHQLVKAIIGAKDDAAAIVVPADPNPQADAVRSLLPMGCALAAATPGFFLSAITIFLANALRREPAHPFWLPALIFAMTFGIGAIGWLAGKGIGRLLPPLRSQSQPPQHKSLC
jgi:hypothetical protein